MDKLPPDPASSIFSQERVVVRLSSRFMPDPFIVGLLTAVALATIVPCQGESARVFAGITDIAIMLLFFLHGAKLSRDAIFDGMGNWRLHLVVLATTYVVFPLLGLALRLAFRSLVSAPLMDGVVFLAILPSTVQSSIAFTSIARGNVPAAVCSASASNLLGIVLTPILAGFLLGVDAGSARGGIDLGAVRQIALQLLLPFIVGHLARPLLQSFLKRHSKIVGMVDRGSILLVVYTAFSAAIVEGLWHQLSLADLAIILAVDIVLLAFVLALTTVGARWLGFDRGDEIAIVFCGSKKSLASGVPIAGVLFPPAIIGPMIVPLMLFHQVQLMVCAVIARRYAARPDEAAPTTRLRSVARDTKVT